MAPNRFLALWILAFCGACESPQDPSPSEPARAFGEPNLAVKLAEPAINESSGLARSHADPGWYYTHNDSGDSARFWKFDLTGKIVGPFTVPGAKAVDWEDMASASLNGKHYLYFADIGDNAARRESIQIYRIEEPMGPAGAIAAVETYELKYPVGAHNAEAFMVDPKNGSFTIVTKTGKGPAKVFLLEGPKGSGSYVLRAAGELSVGSAVEPSRLVTAGDISPDGRFVVVRSYLSAYEFAVPKDGAWWKGKPVNIKVAAEIQGEAIAYSLEGDEILTTSEIAPCPVSRISRLK